MIELSRTELATTLIEIATTLSAARDLDAETAARRAIEIVDRAFAMTDWVLERQRQQAQPTPQAKTASRA